MDTRPLGVNNTDNRIMARVIVNMIAPAAENFVDSEQEAFVPGRDIERHVRAINERFYSAKKAKGKRAILFLDNIKAFDSIDHLFLLKLLEKIGFPPWLVRLVKGLLHEASVDPTFNQKGDFSIRILRGVKQGCPLSPLFILAMDVLTWR